MALELVFETHSTTEDNERGIATGWLPGRLSETGRRQAQELGARRHHDSVAAVFTSDLARAVETAEIAFGGSGIPVHLDRRLRECDYGDLNGEPAALVEAERPKRLDVPFPGGESYREVAERVADFLAELVEGWNDRRVVVIGHSATRWSLDHLLRGIRLEDLVGAPFEWQPGWEYVLR